MGILQKVEEKKTINKQISIDNILSNQSIVSKCVCLRVLPLDSFAILASTKPHSWVWIRFRLSERFQSLVCWDMLPLWVCLDLKFVNQTNLIDFNYWRIKVKLVMLKREAGKTRWMSSIIDWLQTFSFWADKCQTVQNRFVMKNYVWDFWTELPAGNAEGRKNRKHRENKRKNWLVNGIDKLESINESIEMCREWCDDDWTARGKKGWESSARDERDEIGEFGKGASLHAKNVRTFVYKKRSQRHFSFVDVDKERERERKRAHILFA